MLIHRRPATSNAARQVAGAFWASLLLVLAFVLPVAAVEGPTKLIDPLVSPGAGTPTTTITFSVVYRNREGSAPEYVRVVIDGTARAMTGDGGSDWKKGVLHTYATTLPAGSHTFAFEAADTRRFSGNASGGTITITVPPTPTPPPSPPPPPTPAPTPDPTPEPTTAPTPTPSGSTGGTGGSGGSTGTDGGGSDDGEGASPTPAPDAPAAGGGTGAPGSDPDPDGPAANPDGSTTGREPGEPVPGTEGPAPGASAPGDSPDPAPDNGLTAPGSGPDDPTDGTTDGPRGSTGEPTTSGVGWGALAAALDVLGIADPPTLTLLPTLVGTSGAVTMAMAFAIFGKKRRDGAPPAPDEVLEAQAARGTGLTPSAQLVPAPVDEEAAMPRWRRPSLLEARKADPTRYVATTPRMSFENGVVGPVEGHERRVIRYRVVRLMDAPDELRAAEIGQVDQGDEVQLLEKSGAYWLVLCPDGRQGWLHKMTLGEVVTDAPTSTAESWGQDVDDDVLTAFIQARAARA